MLGITVTRPRIPIAAPPVVVVASASAVGEGGELSDEELQSVASGFEEALAPQPAYTGDPDVEGC